MSDQIPAQPTTQTINPESERVLSLLRAAIEAAGLPSPVLEARKTGDEERDWLISVDDETQTLMPTTTTVEGAEVPAWYAGYTVIHRGSYFEPDCPDDEELACDVSLEVVVAALVAHMVRERDEQQSQAASERAEAEEDERVFEALKGLPHQSWCPMASGSRWCRCQGHEDEPAGAEMTTAQCIESDLAYDAARERRVFGRGGRW
jgi:hypothetical protein